MSGTSADVSDIIQNIEEWLFWINCKNVCPIK